MEPRSKRKGLYKNPVLAIQDNLVFGRRAAWAYFVLAEKPYDFLSADGKINLANSTTTALSSLVTRQDATVECHLLITNVVFDPVRWEEQMYRVHDIWVQDYNEPFETFVRNQAESLKEMDYRRRITLLGIKLYLRGSVDFSFNILEIGWQRAKDVFKESVSQLFKVPNDRISDSELLRAQKSENEIYQILSSGGLAARRPTTEDLLLVMKRRYYPSMPAPYLDVSHQERVGTADIARETGGELYVTPKYLKLVQFVNGDFYEGYRATLSFSSFPPEFEIPSLYPPFFARASVLPFTAFSRFYLVPPEKMKADLNKQKLEAEDEISNLQSSGQSVTASLRETVTDIQILEEDLVASNQPWVTGSYHITVEAPTEKQLKETIVRMRQEFAEDETVLTWTSGDQLNLFREEQIGGDIEIKDFNHTTNLALLAQAGINFGGRVGDPIT